MTQPEEITACWLEVLVMPNGEIISLGRSIGRFSDYQDYIVPKK